MDREESWNRDYASGGHRYPPSDLKEVAHYWLSKNWLPLRIKEKLKGAFANPEALSFFSSIPDKPRHLIIETIVYFFWYPDNFLPAFRLLRRNSKQWKITIRRLTRAADELHRNIIPLFDLTGFAVYSDGRLMPMTRPSFYLMRAEKDLRRIRQHLLDYRVEDAESRKHFLRSYGYTERGNMARTKENCGLERLAKLFERETGSPHYDWLREVVRIAGTTHTPQDEKTIIMRVQRYRKLFHSKGVEFLFLRGKRPHPGNAKPTKS